MLSPRVATQAFDPEGGVFETTEPITVMITASTAGANIRYTLDDTNPTETYGSLIPGSSGTVSVTPGPNGGTILRAIAFKTGWTCSYIHSANYSLYQECFWCPPPPSDLNTISPGGFGEEMSASTGGETSTASTNGPAPMAVYLYAGDQIVKNVTMDYYYYQDSLGNTSHITDAAGNLLERYTYDAFGKPTFYNAAPSGTPIPASAKGVRHLFQGQLWTQETGLNDYRNRVALPTMGVFLQPDPIGFQGDALNLYRFCTNNAVNRTDALGLYVDRIWQRQMLWQGGGDGTVSEQLERLQQQAQGASFSMAYFSGFGSAVAAARIAAGEGATDSASVEFIEVKREYLPAEQIPRQKDLGVNERTRSYTLPIRHRTQIYTHVYTGKTNVVIPISAKQVLPKETRRYDAAENSQALRILLSVFKADAVVKEIAARGFADPTSGAAAVERRAIEVLKRENVINIVDTDIINRW